MTGPNKAGHEDEEANEDDGYKPGGSREPVPDPENPGGTAATRHPPAEPNKK